MTGMATALCAAIDIKGDEAPEWVHLLPAGQVRTVDGRGPYTVADVTALCAASMAGGKLALDENHSTDKAAPLGLSAPARGWIVDLQARQDGVWGKVDWTPEGRTLVAGYRGISPVIRHDKRSGRIDAILRASLTNTPNLTGLTSLHSTEMINMDFRALLIEALGLDSDADDAAIAAALKAKMAKTEGSETALQSALAPIAKAAGLAAGSDAAAIALGVQKLVGDGDDRVIALQSEMATLKEQVATDKATAFVDAAIAAGRVGVKPERDEYISMHAANPARAERLINALPIVKSGATVTGDPERGKDGLSGADKAVISLMGIDAAEYAKTLADNKVEAL